MRTQIQMENIFTMAKLAYSYKLQRIVNSNQQGIGYNNDELLKGINIINAFPVASYEEMNLFCDVLIRTEFVILADQKMFSEEIYNEDFDIL